jgi:hypothetical protein
VPHYGVAASLNSATTTRRPAQDLKFANDWLLIFLDETGHEEFAGNQHYFAVGGCAVLGAHYEWLKAKWRELRTIINGSPDAPLHAADLNYTPENLAAVSQLFQHKAFARVAVAATNKTHFVIDMHTMSPVFGMLKEHVARLVSGIPCKTVALIFESSERGDPLVERYFGELSLQQGDHVLPTEHCFMPKSSGEPGLEVADFIASAAGSQARRRHRGTSGFAKDYEAVFFQFPPPFSQFFHIAEVGGSPEDHQAWVQGTRHQEP